MPCQCCGLKFARQFVVWFVVCGLHPVHAGGKQLQTLHLDFVTFILAE